MSWYVLYFYTICYCNLYPDKEGVGSVTDFAEGTVLKILGLCAFNTSGLPSFFEKGVFEEGHGCSEF